MVGCIKKKHPHTQHTIFVTLFLYPTLGMLSHRARLILPCTPGNHPPQAGNADQRNAVHEMETLARTAGVGWTRCMVTGELGSRKQHGLVPHARRISKRTTGLDSLPQPCKTRMEVMEQRKTTQPNKLPLTMEVRCTPLRCVRAAA